jgi:shikimate dehydrogenase
MVAEIDPSARHIGAVNTLHRLPDGWRGYNTDGYGLRQALQASLGCRLSDADIILLGAGGAARSAAAECLSAGCRSLWIGNRTRDNLETLLAALRPSPGGGLLRGFDLSAPDSALPAGAWVINSTSAGLRAEDASPIDLSTIPRPRGVFDMIYNPPETPLLRQARILGIPCANGLGMLVHQGARALEIWSQTAVPVEVMHAAISRR